MSDEKVGSVAVSKDSRITCEVCAANYHAVPGNKNDCPLCNAPGGKGSSANVGTALAGNPLAPQVVALGVTVNQLTVRIAQLESDIKTGDSASAALTQLTARVAKLEAKAEKADS